MFMCLNSVFSLSAVIQDILNYSHWHLLLLFFFPLLPFHCAAALRWPSRTAVRSVSRGSGRPIHPVVHHAPGPSEARPACKTRPPRRHCHPSSPRPAEQDQHRWAIRDNTPSAFPFLTMSQISAGADLAAGLHFVPSVILHDLVG